MRTPTSPSIDEPAPRYTRRDFRLHLGLACVAGAILTTVLTEPLGPAAASGAV